MNHFALCLWLAASLRIEAAESANVFHPAKLAEMDAAIRQAIADKKLPGGVLWLERNGAAYHQAYGQRALVPATEPISEDTIFDAASLTKVVATTPAILLLVERGQLKLDDTAQTHLPEFRGDGKTAITIRQLLTHTSGLRPDLDLQTNWSGYRTAIQLACAEKPFAPPGTAFKYSDINFLLLAEVVQRVTGDKFEGFVVREIFRPLKMNDTGFLPARSLAPRIAPTQPADGTMLRGVVHDPTARRMGGVAGHAGLFTTAADLARYARLLLNLGELDGVRLFKAETVKLMTSVQSPPAIEARRGLGWDIDSGYSRPRGKWFPIGSYGHTGFTGTSLWIDPASQTFWIFLSNRVHPDGQGNILPLQAALGTLAAEAVVGFDFTKARNAPQPSVEGVLNGIDVLVKQNFAPLKGLRVGLITNHTGTDRRRRSTIDLLKAAPGVQLKALLSPEHGIRGAFDDKVDDSVDAATGLPVYSLYPPVPKRKPGQSEADYDALALAARSPRPEQLRDLDALVFDMQDIGCRFYTYIATLGNCLAAAATNHLKFFVLDRVNPINGVAVEGPVHTGWPTFIAYHPLPLRHGMTVGELARMFNAERKLNADLTVIPVEGWRREQWFDETGLPWINPSPNMRSLTAAALYPGLGLHESALSVGRGTDRPFEIFGAPYIDDIAFATELNRAGLAGIRFTPIRFTPTSSTFSNQVCGGVAVTLVDRHQCAPVDVGIVIAQTLRRLYPQEYALKKIERLLQHSPTMTAIQDGKTLAEIKTNWTTALAEFRQRRERYLLYP